MIKILKVILLNVIVIKESPPVSNDEAKINQENDIKSKPEESKKDNPKYQTDDEEEEEEESEEEDKFSTKGFDKEEIKIIRCNQENDPFYDIIKLKNEAVFKDSRIQIFKNADNVFDQADVDEDSISYSKRELIKSNYLNDFEDSNSSKQLNIEESQIQSNSNSLNRKADPSSSKFGVSTMIDETNKNGRLEKHALTFQGSTEKYDLSNK